jgi:hypothetical protein
MEQNESFEGNEYEWDEDLNQLNEHECEWEEQKNKKEQ